MNSIYSTRTLLDELKKAGLPSSYPTLRAYEKKGVILKPKNPLVHPETGREDRLYSWDEILENVSRVKVHIKK